MWTGHIDARPLHVMNPLVGFSDAPVTSREGHSPLLNGVEKVLKGSEGCALTPDAQAAHVDHVSGLRGAWGVGGGSHHQQLHPGRFGGIRDMAPEITQGPGTGT